MRIAHSVSHAIQEGASSTTILVRGGSAAYKTITEHTVLHMILPKESGDVSVSLGGISTAKTLYIEADQDITVKLGGTDKDPIDVKAGFPFALVMATGVTSVHIANPSEESQAVVKGIIGG